MLIMAITSPAQEINTSPACMNICSDNYIRLTVDNDYFTGSDDQYSEGVGFEMVMPWIKKLPVSVLLLHPRFADQRYGLAIEQAGYTPYDLQNEGMPVNDRPFAATLYLKSFVISNDPVGRQRTYSALSTGIIGPDAVGAQLQENVHVITNNTWPPGWRYQLHNNLLLNYEAGYEKELYAYPGHLGFSVACHGRAGTFSDLAGAGFRLMAGRFQSPFVNERMPGSSIQAYLFENPEISFVAYDATLQGGAFDGRSPYVLTASEVSRVVLENQAGAVFCANNVYLEYSEHFASARFSGGPQHLYGSIRLGIALDQRK